MKILVALDGSTNSDAIFDIAVRQIVNKKSDSLYLLTVTESATSGVVPLGSVFSIFLDETQEEPEKFDAKGEHVKILTKYATKCASRGIENHAILGVAEHVGTLICQAVEEKGIDLVVLGRRKFGTFERLFAGSSSRYCIENALCNVLVVKDDMPAEVHSDLTEVIEATEAERARRVRQEKVVEVHSNLAHVRKLEEQERRRRMEEAGPSTVDPSKQKFEADLSRNIARMAEEEERQRRIKEEESLDNREKIERDMAKQSVLRAEEKERSRRVQEDKDIEKGEQLQRLINQKTADIMEEQERERRLEEEAPVFIDRKLQVELLGSRS